MTIKTTFLKNLPRWVILLIDIFIVAITYICSNYIINSFIANFDISYVLLKTPIIVAVYLFYFLILGTYKGIIRQTGIEDAQNVFYANLLAFGTLLISNFVLRSLIDFESDLALIPFKFSYSIIFIHSFVATVIMVALRVLYKVFYQQIASNNIDKTNVVVYGAGTAGALTYNAINNDPSSNTNILFFIDDDYKKSNNKINGISIYHSSILTPKFVKDKNIKEIIISIQNISNKGLFNITKNLEDLDVKIKITPPVDAWIDRNYSAKQIKNLQLEDLLGRETIKLDNPVVSEELKGNTILVTGAAGSIGSEIARQIAQKDFNKLILVDIAESALYDLQQSIKSNKKDDIKFIIGNIRDHDRMKAIFNLYKPDYIYHAAAYKHVPMMEKFPFEAVNTNIKGTKIIADLANEFSIKKFVMVSTDKAVNPTNVMGASKRCAEIYVNYLNYISETNYIVTRFGNVLGSNGSVIPLFKRQMEAGGPLTVTDEEVTRYFMTIPEACQLVLEAGAMGNGGEIYVFDMGESVKIIDLAKKMIHLSGYKYPEDIDIKIIGLRPGEKKYEELLANDENTIKTHHEKIMIAKVNTNLSNEIILKIEDLIRFSSENESNLNYFELVKQIKYIVPEFKSENSEYSSLDLIS